MIDFEKNSYTVVKGLIEPEWCKTLYNYVGYSADRCGLKQKHDEEKYREAWDGTFQDKQCPGNYAHYGDPMMDSMMMAHGKKIEEVTGMTLAPSYTYYRMYLNGAILKRHKDRPSCEISATICIEQDTDNGKPWPIWLLNNKNYAGYKYEPLFALSQKKSLSDRRLIGCKEISMNPGDVLLYQGINVLHWRDPLEGNFSKNIFVHYVDKNGPLFMQNPSLKFDGRKSIFDGYDAKFQNYQSVVDLNARSENDPDWLAGIAAAGISNID